MQAFEVFIKEPTPFMIAHWPYLLPDWTVAPQSLGIALLRAQFSLVSEEMIIETEKDRLLREFLTLGQFIRQKSLDSAYRIDIISPKDGLPLYSSPGTLIFDSVAAVNYWLNFPYDRTEKGCKILTHPQWQQAVYPGLFVSTASPSDFEALLTCLSLSDRINA